MSDGTTVPIGSDRLRSVDYLRVLATLLITNAHLGELYPRGLSRLSFGGMFGDCLFFLISGFCLATPRESFLPFLKRRCLRIYIPYALCVLLLWPSGFMSGWRPVDYLFPIETYTFLPCIITLYPLFYICAAINKRARNRGFLWLLLLAAAVNIAYFFCVFDFRNDVASLTENYSFLQVSSFFIAMLMGGALRTNMADPGRAGSALPWGAAALVFLALFVLQAVRPLSGGFRILHWYLAFGFVSSVATFFLRLEPRLKAYPIIKIIAPLTLEVYLLQFVIIAAFSKTPFYTGWILCMISIFASAFVVNRASQRILALMKLSPRVR